MRRGREEGGGLVDKGFRDEHSDHSLTSSINGPFGGLDWISAKAISWSNTWKIRVVVHIRTSPACT
jgi:hypothetical protein